MSTRLLIIPACLAIVLLVYLLRPTAELEPTDGSRPANAPLPDYAAKWEANRNKLAKGLVKAGQLRSRLIASKNDSGEAKHPTAEAVAQLIRDFQEAVGPRSSQPSLLRHDVQSFDVSSQKLIAQLRGKDDLSVDVFDAFNGRWYGVWDQMEVDHDWRPSIHFSTPRIVADDQPPLVSLQYAWIGNGFGWNYLAAVPSQPDDRYVLGMVYYLASPDYDSITGENPHVGFADSPNRLVWITESNIFLEEAFPESLTGEPGYYVITGLSHQLFSDQPGVSPEVVQATYTRDPQVRPDFQKATWRK